jgi:V/A-type H+-transporting ATPase subunit K
VASDALAETGQGFGQYIMVLGVVETVALFVMVFLLGVVAV